MGEEHQQAVGVDVGRLLHLLHRLVEVLEFSGDSLQLTVRTLAPLAACQHLDPEALDALCYLVKSLARHSMSETLFENSGVTAVLKIVSLFAKPAFNLGSNHCRQVFNKLLEVYVTRNAACNQRRLSPSTLVQLLEAVAAMGILTDESWSAWPAAVNNQAGILDSMLDVDSDEPTAKLDSLARYLAHPSQVVRSEAARILLTLPLDKSRLVRRILPLVFDELWQREVSTCWTEEDVDLRRRFCFSLLAGLVSVDKQHARAALSLAFTFVKKAAPEQLNLTQVTALIAQEAGYPGVPQRLLKDLLPGLLHDFLNNSIDFTAFPVQLWGYNDATLDQFAKDFEGAVVSLLLLRSPNQATLEELSRLLAKPCRQIVEDNRLSLASFFFPGMAAEETRTALIGKAGMVALGNFVSRVLGEDFMQRLTSLVPNIITSAFTHVQARVDVLSKNHINPPPPPF